MKSPMTHQNLSHQGWQWLCSWMGLTTTPPTLLALVLLAGWTPEAAAQTTHTLSPLEIYEGERLTFTLQTTDTSITDVTVLVNNPNIQPLPTASYTSDYLLYGVGEENPTSNTYSNGSYVIAPIVISNGSIQFDLEAVTDNTSESDETITVAMSDYDDDYNFNFRLTFTVTLKDGARPASGDGVTISPTSLALTELGTSSAMEKTYTVVLDTDPTADVTITVANGDNTAVAVDTDSGTSGDQSTLTFTAGGDGSGSGAGNGNWATAQTVTVRALNDPDGANESFNLTHTATATGSTAPYDGITIDPVAITTTDAGHGVVVSESSLSVAENDETATYTVVLKSQPSGNVEITTTSSATGTATASPATLTFTNSNWNTPKTVTVTGKGAGSTSISHAVATSADTTNYPTSTTIPAVAVTVTVTAKSPGLTITETDSDTTVSEDGTTVTDTYTVVLNTEPTHDVTVTASAGAGVQVAGPGGTAGGTATLTFTASNYSTAQTVTVTGVDDNVDNPGGGRDVSISHAASSTDSNYTISSGGTVEATVTDDDATRVTLSDTAVGRNDIVEGQTMDFTITLDRGLVDGESLTVPLTFGGTAIRGTDYTMTGTVADGVQYNNLNSGSVTVVFTGPESGVTATRATITLSATADGTMESAAAETLIIDFGAITGLEDAGGARHLDRLGTLNIWDLDSVGVTVSPSSLSLRELGDSSTVQKSYTVVLNTNPIADVALTISGGNTTAALLSVNAVDFSSDETLFFHSTNWNTAQTVTVRALNDANATDESFNVTHSALVLDTNNPYHGIAIDPVAISIMDAGHGVVVSESSLSVAENDETATYTVALKSQPSGNVVISATSGATATATVSPGTLTFGTSDWNTPKTFTVTGKGAGSTSISHAVATSADTTNYPTTTTIPSVAVTVTAQTVPTLKVEIPTVTEGETGTIKLTLSQTASQEIEITPVAQVIGTCTGVCPQGTTNAGDSDYSITTTTITFATGETTKTISFTATDDNTAERRGRTPPSR